MCLSEIFFAFCISLSAWVFVNLLQDEGMLFEWYGKLLEKLPAWLSHLLGKCDLCLAGQLGFWGYFLTGKYEIIEHLFFVIFSIFFVKIIDRLIYGLR